jgi:hypothetical protein
MQKMLGPSNFGISDNVKLSCLQPKKEKANNVIYDTSDKYVQWASRLFTHMGLSIYIERMITTRFMGILNLPAKVV